MLAFRTIALPLAVVLALAGCSAGSGDTPEAPALSVSVPDAVGLWGDVAEDLITDAGFEVEFESGPEAVLRTSLWVVGSQEPVPGSARPEGSTVTLHFLHPEDAHRARAIRLVREAQPEPYAIRAATVGTLAEIAALEVCIERTWAKDGGPDGELPGSSAGYVVVTFPDETLSAVQEGTCDDFIPSSG